MTITNGDDTSKQQQQQQQLEARREQGEQGSARDGREHSPPPASDTMSAPSSPNRVHYHSPVLEGGAHSEQDADGNTSPLNRSQGWKFVHPHFKEGAQVRGEE